MQTSSAIRLRASALLFAVSVLVPLPTLARDNRDPVASHAIAFPHAGSSAASDTLSMLPVVASSLAWIEQKIVTADGGSGDLFGFRTLVVGDTAFISAPAPLARAGAVYVFHDDNGQWTQTQRIVATQPEGTPPNWSDFFGWSLSVSGDKLLVGAPETFDPMGGPVGGAYVFTRDGNGQWQQQQRLASPLPMTFGWFGGTVAFSGDVAVVAESSYNLSTEGGRGAVHVFTFANDTWTATQLVQSSDGANNDGAYFGNGLAASNDLVLVGAPGPDFSSNGEYVQGAVYVFSNSGGTLAETTKLTASDGADGDQFGFSIAMSGNLAVIGAAAANIGSVAHQGAAYLFDHAGGPWQQTQKWAAADGAEFDQYGQAVALDGNTAVIGMWSHNDDPSGTQPPAKPGRAGVYVASNGIWSQASELGASDGTNGDSYGWHVATNGATLLVGADADGSVSQYQGSAYFYADDTLFADGFDPL